ncbi:hypothetical protein H5410_014225 [Solanum commersonii]|uniref:Uncharacterized protein n=1 Tax=Solanum commersonii TaxID=4109 RepID=A0A9J5ZQC0_SOLCO|nr:hypothetical protein H5410_014225 [Solanum commersonii]
MELDHNQNVRNNSSSTPKKERIETKIYLPIIFSEHQHHTLLKQEEGKLYNQLPYIPHFRGTSKWLYEEILHINFSQNPFNNVSIQLFIPRPTTTKQPPPETHHAKQPSPSPPDDEQHQHSTTLHNREPSVPKKSEITSQEIIPNVAICDLRGDAQPEPERSQPHISTKYNR